jgi:hypothetical protein
MADKGWQRKFEVPILLPDGRYLVTLRDAADYIIALPTETANLRDWQLAMEALSLVSESGPTTLARLAFLKALKLSWHQRKKAPIQRVLIFLIFVALQKQYF